MHESMQLILQKITKSVKKITKNFNLNNNIKIIFKL